MQAPFEMSEGRARLRQILSELPSDSPHWNEAQNRFQFVDRMLTECLGWTHPFISVESSDDAGGKADYVLGKPPKAVLEAKREAVQFDTLPIGKPTALRKLRPLLEASKPLEDAVLQVVSYCSLKGAQVAIICNGPQLLIFQAIVIGQSPLDGECYLFNGVNNYLDQFHLLWTLLSPEGISENRAYRQLALHRTPRVPPKASTTLPEPFRFRHRTALQENLNSVASLLLEDIEEHPAVKSEFYRECYVPIDANNRHLLLSKNIIAARYERVVDGGSVPISIDKSSKFGSTDGALSDEVGTGALSARPIIVIGDVGVGKTSFFENLFENLDEAQRRETYFISINLGTKAALAADVKTFVLESIPRTLRSDYDVDIFSSDFLEAIYYRELQDFERGVFGPLKAADPPSYARERVSFLSALMANRDRHLLAALGHLAQGRKKQIILVLDNADQRRFETQQDAFLIAQELAATRNVLVFVALRPSTFYQSKLTGTLSGYHSRVLSISPPPADEVLEKRIAFAVRVAEGKIAPASLSGIRFNLKNIVLFLRATLRTVRDTPAIRTFLSNITGGNTRMVVELISGFCGSPNIDTDRIVRMESDIKNYHILPHEFIRHSLLGEYSYFNSQSSSVACNIFDVTDADPREHFLGSLIIAFLTSSLGTKDADGFVTGTAIIQEMLKHNFLEDQTRHAIRRLASRRLIETPHAHYREIEVSDDQSPDSFHYRATTIGVYHVTYWTGAFTFLEATSTDTPIFDQDARDEIFKRAGSFDLSDRVLKADVFRKYLEAQWHLANISASYYDFVTYMQMQEDSFKLVRSVVQQMKRGGSAARN